MRNLKKFMATMMALMIAATCTVSIAFAGPASSVTMDQDEIEAYLSSVITNINEEDRTFNSTIQNLDDYIVISASGLYKINGHSFDIAEGKSKDDLVAFISSQSTLGVADPNGVKSQLGNTTQTLNVTANTTAAATMLSGLAPIVSIGLGVLVTLITIGMTIYSAFDIAYIAFPVFRNKCEEAKVNGGAMAKTTSNGDTKLRFVTDDAQYAVQQGSVESGKSPWGIYFKKRVASYVLLAIILFILMTGNINLITNIALKVVSGIMGVLQSLG